ncbi:hypothetical protein ACQKC9_07595 [Psychrobacter sp. NPDC078409]|uniref:hypothetical protein n=1 Tax=unclassified Psychrobacter TaxID=196806 RepID=UPI00071101A8|nr:hypothetical protein [Psychrobacter sp. P11G3]KRG35789.1 hypothetical protein AK824_00815 [Psychrobacter sp. P11G3]
MPIPYYKAAALATRCMQTLVISTVLASIAANSAIAKNSDTPLHFSKSAISSVITGKLNPNDNERWYRFDATSGQYAVINITLLAGTSETANVGVLHMPNGTQDGGKGGIVYQGCLPATGTYRLRIARNFMATEGKIAGYKVEVMILPTYASQLLCN